MWCKAINRLARIAFKVHVRNEFYGCFKIHANNCHAEGARTFMRMYEHAVINICASGAADKALDG